MNEKSKIPLLYYSTRSSIEQGKGKTFTQAVLKGLSEDGGLFIPYPLEKISKETQESWSKLNYRELCFHVIRKFVPAEELSDATLREIIHQAYKGFQVAECLTLKKLHPVEDGCLNNLTPEMYLMELFHGPSLAFKDFGLQFLAQLLLYLSKQAKRKSVVLVATSGDTGAAAVSSFDSLQDISCVVLYPAGKISRVQELQMTSTEASNIYCVAVEGASFNDCQTYVKTLLNSPLHSHLNLRAVNSINWGRLVAQIVYYWYALFRVKESKQECPYFDICVPTGNFGNLLAAFYAKEMGAPIRHCIIASNVNGKFTQFLKTGQYCGTSSAIPTFSPAMDIQVSSNLERLIHLLLDYDGPQVASLYKELSQQGSFDLKNPKALQSLRKAFHAYNISDQETLQAISLVYKATQSHSHERLILIDPHTAVAYAAALKYIQKGTLDTSTTSNGPFKGCLIIVSTAHFSKFTDTLVKAIPGFTDLNQLIPSSVKRLLCKQHSRRYTCDNNMESLLRLLQSFFNLS